jgi:molecular chaperone GrpE
MRRFIRLLAPLTNRLKAHMTSNESSQPLPADDEDADASAGESDPIISLPASELEALRREGAEWKERCARSQAEFDNARKRLRKEADEAGTRAVARFVKPVLGEIDNLERALSSAKPASFAEFASGVSMIHANLQAALVNAGIETVPVEGLFDPAVHEVIAETEHADRPRGTIVQVHRPGYRLKDQLVRAAQVVVARPPAQPTGEDKAPE